MSGQLIAMAFVTCHGGKKDGFDGLEEIGRVAPVASSLNIASASLSHHCLRVACIDCGVEDNCRTVGFVCQFGVAGYCCNDEVCNSRGVMGALAVTFRRGNGI